MSFTSRQSEWDAADYALAALLFAAAVAYLSLLRHQIGTGDESYFLYEAKRIRDGEVMYRDFFQFVTPLSSYAMAGLYWLFGTTIATARISMNVLHAATAVVLYATARRLAVRRALAIVVVVAYLAICQSLYPFASWHWFATFAAAALLLTLLLSPWAMRPAWALVPGIVNGLLIGIQQQKGAVFAVGTCLVFLLDHLVDHRYGPPEPLRRLVLRLVFFAAGVAAVVLPMLAIFAILAGPETVYAALVRFPLENYRGTLTSYWAILAPMAQGFAGYTFPAALKYSPVPLALPALECVLAVLRGRDRQHVRGLIALVVLSGFSVLSIWYYPDLFHIAFIAAGFWVCAAVGVEWLLSALPSPALARLAGALIAVGVSAPLLLHLAQHGRELRRLFSISHDTAFGQVDFSARWQPIFTDRLRQLLAESGSTDLFCYSPVAVPYLTTGGHNPTPYQFLSAAVSPPEHVRNALAILRQRRVRYVVTSAFYRPPNDTVIEFIEDNYEPVSLAEYEGINEWPPFQLYRLKAEARPSD